MSDFIIYSYFPSNLFFGENRIKVSIFYKLYKKLKKYRQVPLINKKGNRTTFKKGVSILKRKRKTIVADLDNELILHSFYFPFKKNLYEKTRSAVEQQFISESICFPRYACNQHLGGMLVVAEEKISGVALQDCEQLIVEKFLATYLNSVNKNIPSHLSSETDYKVYELLHTAFLRLKKILPKNSSFFKLSLICGEPFKKQKGYWPTSYCHGQVFPINIIYNKLKEDKFYFIDFEPGLMGIGPYAYDFVFFILYASDLISSSYMKKMAKKIFSEYKTHNWAQYFLAQIIWWSRNKTLNSKQLKKIELRSLKTLSLINETI